MTSPSPAPRRDGALQILPAIDLRGGQVVRLERGDDARRTTYPLEPRALLERFASLGCTMVHVIDLDGAFGEAPQRALIENLASQARGFERPLRIELGGGLRDEDAVAWALDAGCARVILGSMVAKDPARFEALVERFPGRLVPALEIAGGTVRVGGWTEATALTADALADRLRGLACPAVLVTDVERDGLLTGPNVELARRVARRSGIPTIVSGGVRALEDVEAAVSAPEVESIIIGKALYEERVELADALRIATLSASPSETSSEEMNDG
ncbi:MAG: 1-(5-phosphoribosyl)-5-[(5-phosphoribosylamino)methylideneamino] imidazole-4-carboxamide isomerase [Acidobacteriota bacterium]